MDSLYYKDTKSAIEDLGEEDFSFLNKDLQRIISTVLSEVDSFMDYFEEVVTERDTFAERVEELEQMVEDYQEELNGLK